MKAVIVLKVSDIHLTKVTTFHPIFIAPLCKSGSYTGFALSFRHSVILSFCHSVILWPCLWLCKIFRHTFFIEDWNLVHMWTVDRCIVYTGIRLLLPIRPFISSFFFLSNFRTLKSFVTLFSGTVRSRRLKLSTHVDSGQMYRVYRNQAGAGYSSLSFFTFLSLQFSNIKIFRHIFLRNCEA